MAEEENNYLTFDIFRDDTEGVSKLNRICLDLHHDKVAYYCDVTPEQVAIHRGDKDGPIIATSDSFKSQDGITEISLTEMGATIPIRHKHHTMPFLAGDTFFRAEGKQFKWKKHTELVEEDTGTLLASFQVARGSSHLGSLYVFPPGEAMVDTIIITSLVDQERSDEKRMKVKGLRRILLIL